MKEAYDKSNDENYSTFTGQAPGFLSQIHSLRKQRQGLLCRAQSFTDSGQINSLGNVLLADIQ